MVTIDRDLLATIARSRPRVAILPTASAPKGEATFRAWADMGRSHFAALGAEVELIEVRTVRDGSDGAALQAIGEADLIYVSGGSPSHLRSVLTGSPLGDAIRAANLRGAAVAGCSAGSMAIAGWLAAFRLRALPWPIRWSAGLDLLPECAVLPHYDAWPEALVALVALQAPPGVMVLGIDEDTAIIQRDGLCEVRGRGRVTVWQGRHRERFRRGESFLLAASPLAVPDGDYSGPDGDYSGRTLRKQSEQ